MRKLFPISLVLALACGAGTLSVAGQNSHTGSTGSTSGDPTTQTQTQSTQSTQSTEIHNMGRAPETMNGIGRLDLRVVDQNGAPVYNAYAVLESRRTDGFYCEAFGSTDSRGVLAMPPLHMGDLTLKVKARGFEKYQMNIERSALSEPVRVTLTRKS